MATGFPSPAEDYLDQALDLNEHLIKHPAATFFIRAKSNSLQWAGIHAGDIILIDRSLQPQKKDIVLVVINGEFSLKQLGSVKITEEMDFTVWGVAIHSVHKLR